MPSPPSHSGCNDSLYMEAVTSNSTTTSNHSCPAHMTHTVSISSHSGGLSLLASLSFFDRYLPVWIIGAMVIGVVLGYYTNAADHLAAVQVSACNSHVFEVVRRSQPGPKGKAHPTQYEKQRRVVQLLLRNCDTTLSLEYVINEQHMFVSTCQTWVLSSASQCNATATLVRCTLVHSRGQERIRLHHSSLVTEFT